MKRILCIMILSMLVVVLGACNGKETNTISLADLTEREDSILSMTTDQAFVFDFNVDDTYEEVLVMVERYEKGILVEDKIMEGGGAIKESGSIVFSTAPNLDNDNESTFTIGINSESDGESNKSSYSTSVTENKNLKNAMSTTGSIEEKNTPIKGEMILASICYTSDENGMTSLSSAFYENPKSNLHELKEFDVVYLLKSEFK